MTLQAQHFLSGADEAIATFVALELRQLDLVC